jgi:Raf kinase inhibitor-like YbhB/YbcL family protein
MPQGGMAHMTLNKSKYLVAILYCCVLLGHVEIAKGAKQEASMTWQLSSSAFRDGSWTPKQHTCEGADISPPLAWTQPPANTKTLALICDDPDAPRGVWVHWVLYNLPAKTTELPEQVPKDPQLASGAIQGLNDFGKIGYGGPCPPPGAPHHYIFTLYALDSALTLPPRSTKAQLLEAMQGHILDQTKLVGLYQR